MSNILEIHLFHSISFAHFILKLLLLTIYQLYSFKISASNSPANTVPASGWSDVSVTAKTILYPYSFILTYTQ